MQSWTLASASRPISPASSHKFKLHPQPGRPLLLPNHRLPLQKLVISRFVRTNAAQSEEQQPVAVTARQSWELESPFLEPWVRAFILGVGSAVILETGHVALQFLGLLASAGPAQIASVLPDMSSLFAPLVLADNMAAIGGWAFFYIIEVVAILSVLRAHSGDREGAAHALRNLVTLPKRMLPMRLALLKYMMTPTGTLQPSTSAAAAPSRSAPSVRPATADKATGVLPPTASAFVDAPVLPGTVPPLPRQVGLPPAVLGDAPRTPEQEQEQAGPLGRAEGETLGESRARRGLRPGQLDDVAGGFAKRQKELAGRTAYLRNFWYAAALSESVKDGEPLGVELLGQKVVLFRGTDGRMHCLGDVCPHRGAPLSSGWVSKVDGHDCVVCPYHGWAFDESGALRDVPAAEHAGEWPKRPIVDVFPVEEKGGFVWVFFGSAALPADERPPIPYVPELDDEGWKAVYGEIEFECNHHGVFENAIDMAHIHYLHSDSFGNQGQPKIRDMQCTTDAYGVTATFKLNNKAMPGWEWTSVPEVAVTARAMLPSTSVISFTLGSGLSFTTFVNTVPIGPNKTVNRFALVRNLSWDKSGMFNADAWDVWARKAMLRILGEDKAMVEQLRPDLLPQEYSVRADLPQIAFRKLRQQYVDMGYAVSPLVGEERFRSDF